MICNPINKLITKTISPPLYYTAVSDVEMTRDGKGKLKKYQLDRKYNVQLELEVQARGYTWFVIE